MAMFGLVISGRLVDTSFHQVDPTHFVVNIADVNSFNHIVVFLTGSSPFPEGAGGAVYFSWPEPESTSGPNWQYLGMISNAKPSAIFKVAKLKTGNDELSSISSKFGQQMLQSQPAREQQTAQVGISLESLSTLDNLQQASVETEAAQVPKFMEFAQKMVNSLFNYTASFAIDSNEARMRTSETYVPYSAVQNWCTNFERKLKIDPYFWAKQ